MGWSTTKHICRNCYEVFYVTRSYENRKAKVRFCEKCDSVIYRFDRSPEKNEEGQVIFADIGDLPLVEPYGPIPDLINNRCLLPMEKSNMTPEEIEKELDKWAHSIGMLCPINPRTVHASYLALINAIKDTNDSTDGFCKMCTGLSTVHDPDCPLYVLEIKF